MSISVRQLEAGDKSAWQPLWSGYQDFYRVSLSPEVTEATWRRILDPSEPVLGLGAIVDSRLTGFAHCLFHRSTWMVADTCYLQDLYVEPQSRGKGVARRLIEAVYAHADAACAGQVYWLTHHTNTAARLLYDRVATNAGFIVYERHVESGGSSGS